jgi:hypothetical protein
LSGKSDDDDDSARPQSAARVDERVVVVCACACVRHDRRPSTVDRRPSSSQVARG